MYMNHFTNPFQWSHADLSLMGRAIIRRFALFPLMLLILLLLPARMAAQTAASSSKYIATYDSSTETLTFRKNVGESLPSNSVWVEDKETVYDMAKELGLEDYSIKHVTFDESFKTFTPTSLSYFFTYNLETITGLENLNTKNVTNMQGMFQGCLKLKELDVTHFNTANVTNMIGMFRNCEALTSLDVTNFNTANVTKMSDMFSYCQALTSLDVTNFNTENVTEMGGMFNGCYNLSSLDVTNFNTVKVTNMNYMFWHCYKLSSLDVTKFNTGKVTNMRGMFSDCKALTSLDLTYFNTENVTKMEYMFSDCLELTAIFASNKFVTHQVSTSNDMFSNCKKLKGDKEWTEDNATDKTYATINGGYFTRNNAYPCVKYADGTLTFYYKNNKTLGENEYELNSDKKAPEWLTYKDNITNVVFDTSFAKARPMSCYHWFYECKKLKQIEGIEYLNTEEVTNMEGMFTNCQALTSLDVTNFNTEKVTTMKNMFADCQALTSLDLTNFNTTIVEAMFTMFNDCSALTTIYASDKFVITKDIWDAVMFYGCTKLKGAIEYDEKKIERNYANYKTGYFTKLVGKNGDEKIGAVGETLTADNLTLADDKDFVAYEPFAAKAASYIRTIKTGTTWGTLCLPFEVSLAEQNFRAFNLLSANEGTNTVELEELKTSIAAGTPVIIKMNEGETQLNFTIANKAIANEVKTAKTADGNYQLQGLYTQKEFSKDADNNCYIVKGNKLMNPAKLLVNTSTTQVGSKPFRAYMVDNTSSAGGAKMFSIGFDNDSTTAIDNLNTIADDKAEYYDLQGKRLNEPQKGINIVKRNGKTMKVIIK